MKRFRPLVTSGVVLGSRWLLFGAAFGSFLAAPRAARCDTAGYSGSGAVNNAYTGGGITLIADDPPLAPGVPPSGSNGGLYSGGIDLTTGYALFGSSKGTIVKVSLGSGNTAPAVIGYTSGAYDGWPVTSGTLSNMIMDTRSTDISQHYAYVTGTTGSNGSCSIMKVQLFPGKVLGSAPKVVGIIPLAIPSALPQSAVDLVNAHAFYATFQNGTLLQLDLNTNAVTSVTGLPANLNYWQMRLANNILYISDSTQITRVKLDANGALPTSLNAGNLDSLPTPGGTATFYADTNPAHPYAYGAVFTLDPTHQSTSVPATFTRYNIGSGTMSQGPSSVLYLPNAQNPVASFYVSLGEIDPDSHCVLMGTDNALPGSFSKINGEASGGPVLAGTIVLPVRSAHQPWPYNGGDLNIRSVLIDPGNGYVYCGTDSGVSNSAGTRVLKLQYSQKGSIKGNQITLPAGAALTSVNLFANMPAPSGSAWSSGNARLALYADTGNGPGAVLWQSGNLDTTTVAAGGAWISASDSALRQLAITGGNYWLAWQMDTTCDVPAFAGVGSAGSAFTVAQSFGAFGDLTGVSTTTSTDLWQMNAVFTPPTGLTLFRSANGLAADGSQDAFEPAGDGVANVSKYAFNMIGLGAGQVTTLLTPTQAAVGTSGIAGLPSVGQDASGRLTLTCVRRKSAASPAPGITYFFEFSNDLSPISWAVNAAATETVTSIDTNYERVVVTDSIVGTSRRFGRVRVTVP